MRLPEVFVKWEVANFDPKDRTRFYGGSDMPAIVGEDPFKTPLLVWYEKTGMLPEEESDQMLVGRLFEKPIIEMFRQKSGYIVYDEVPPAKKEIGLSLPLVGHVDGLALVNGELVVVEVKNLNYFNNRFEHYRWQVLFYMYLYGLRRAFLVILRGGSQLLIYDYEYDEEAVQYMLQKLREFDVYLVTDTRPEPFGTEREVEILLKLQATVENTTEIEDTLLDEYIELGRQIKELERRQNEVKARILQVLEENNATIGVGSVYMAKIIRGTRKIKPILEEKEVQYTQLRVVKRKGGESNEESDL